LRTQHCGEAGGETWQVRDVGEHVVGGDQVGAAITGGQARRGIRAEEHLLGAHADPARRGGDAGGGFDTQHGDVHRLEMLQQVAVVRRHLGDQRGSVQIETRRHGRGIALGVCHPAGGER
jgi:hypothetical protein